MVYRVKNWNKFQHFKDRKPPWVKLYHDLLDDMEWFALEPSSAKMLINLWLIASENCGVISDTSSKLAWRLRMTTADIDKAVHELVASGFIYEANDDDAPEDGLTPAQQIAKNNGFGSRYIPDATKTEVTLRDGGKCVYCGSFENIEYDHKIPVSRGGESTFENVQLLCRSCNRKKRNKIAAEGCADVCADTPATSAANTLHQAQHTTCDKRSLETETERETYTPETEAKTKTEVDCPSNSAPEAKPNVSPAAPPRRADSSQGKRLPSDWKLPKAWGEWAMEDNPALTAEDVRKEGEKFRNHWVAKAGKDARKIDWKATWANWIRSDYVKPSGAVPAGLSKKWFLSGKGIEAKGLELGIVMRDNELFPNFKSRVYAAANITDEMVRNAQADAPRHV